MSERVETERVETGRSRVDATTGAGAPRSARGRPSLPARVALLVVGAFGLWLASQHLLLSLDKHYNIDEFQYAHGAWKIAQGEVIFRDFFEHHLPFVHQWMAGVWRLVGDQDPGNILFLRLAMWPFLLLTAFAAWALNARRLGAWSVLTAVAVWMVPSYSVMAVEIRPDPIAAAFFLSALAVHTLRRPSPAARGALSGVFLVAALWATLKVVYYGMIFPIALAVDLWRRRRGARDGFLLSHPVAFLAGAALAALPIAVYLTLTGTWDDTFEWTVSWSFLHQWHYPGFPWVRNMVPLLAQSFWLFPLGIVGLVATFRGSRDEDGADETDLLLVGALVTTLASFAWQSAAYLYSLIPFTLVLVIFAVRGLVATWRAVLRTSSPTSFGNRWGESGRVFIAALLAFLVAFEGHRAVGAVGKLRAADNSEQHAIWARMHALTRPDEPVYHIAGGQITRPSVHYYYFMEAVIRKLKHQAFAEEYPRALAESGCVAYLWTERFDRLAPPLRDFLWSNYVPYDRDLWFWGRRYSTSGGSLDASFEAIRDGAYFVWPPTAARALEIDGEALDATAREGGIFELGAGRRRIVASGAPADLFIVWLPADGVPFQPRPDLKPPR